MDVLSFFVFLFVGLVFMLARFFDWIFCVSPAMSAFLIILIPYLAYILSLELEETSSYVFPIFSAALGCMQHSHSLPLTQGRNDQSKEGYQFRDSDYITAGIMVGLLVNHLGETRQAVLGYFFGFFLSMGYAHFGIDGRLESLLSSLPGATKGEIRQPDVLAKDTTSIEDEVPAHLVIEEKLKEISDLEKKCSVLTKDYDNEKKSNSCLERTVSQSRQKIKNLERELSRFRERINSLQNENLSASSDNEQLRNYYERQDKTKQKELETAKQQLKRLEQDNQALKTQLSTKRAAPSPVTDMPAADPLPPSLLPPIKISRVPKVSGRKARVPKQRKWPRSDKYPAHILQADAARQTISSMQCRFLEEEKAKKVAIEAEETARVQLEAALEEKSRVEGCLEETSNLVGKVEAEAQAFREHTKVEFAAGLEEIRRLQSVADESQSRFQDAEKRAQRAKEAEAAKMRLLREAVEEVKRLKEELKASKKELDSSQKAATEAQEHASRVQMECELNHGPDAIIPDPISEEVLAVAAAEYAAISSAPRKKNPATKSSTKTQIPGLNMASNGTSPPASLPAATNPPLTIPRNSGTSFVMNGMANFEQPTKAPPLSISRNSRTPFIMNGMANLEQPAKSNVPSIPQNSGTPFVVTRITNLNQPTSAAAPSASPAPSVFSAPPRDYGIPFTMVPAAPSISPAPAALLAPPAPSRNHGIPFIVASAKPSPPPAAPTPLAPLAPPRNYCIPFTTAPAAPAPANKPPQAAQQSSWDPNVSIDMDFSFSTTPAAPAPANKPPQAAQQSSWDPNVSIDMDFSFSTTPAATAPAASNDSIPSEVPPPASPPVARRRPTTRQMPYRGSLLTSTQAEAKADMAKIVKAFKDNEYDPNKPHQG